MISFIELIVAHFDLISQLLHCLLVFVQQLLLMTLQKILTVFNAVSDTTSPARSRIILIVVIVCNEVLLTILQKTRLDCIGFPEISSHIALHALELSDASFQRVDVSLLEVFQVQTIGLKAGLDNLATGHLQRISMLLLHFLD